MPTWRLLYAPTNLDGYKSALTIDSSKNRCNGETHLLYFTLNTTAKTRSGENGQWYPDLDHGIEKILQRDN